MDEQDFPNADEAKRQGGTAGVQTLLRGLDVAECLMGGPLHLAELCQAMGVNRSTTHRLASALVERGYLRFERGSGYSLGPKFLAIGYAARGQIEVAKLARPVLEALADATGDTVHLGILDGDRALYLDKVHGRRRINIGSRVGERHSLCATGLGKALLLDETPAAWQARFYAERLHLDARSVDFTNWQARMRKYVEAGCAFDLEENEDVVRCVAAPLRDETGAIVAAISVSSASHYMEHARMDALRDTVRESAAKISLELGYSPAAAIAKAKVK